MLSLERCGAIDKKPVSPHMAENLQEKRNHPGTRPRNPDRHNQEARAQHILTAVDLVSQHALRRPTPFGKTGNCRIRRKFGPFSTEWNDLSIKSESWVAVGKFLRQAGSQQGGGKTLRIPILTSRRDWFFVRRSLGCLSGSFILIICINCTETEMTREHSRHVFL